MPRAEFYQPRDRGFERSMQCRDPDGFTIEFAKGDRGHNATDPSWNEPRRAGGAPRSS